MPDTATNDLIALTSDIASAYVGNNNVAASEVAGLIKSIHAALMGASNPVVIEEQKQEPAVPVRSSVKHDYIVCLEDGTKLKMLKRYLRTNYNMTPEEYRAKWGLPRDYPMVAPAYADQRRALAKTIGLGRKAAAQKKAPTKTAQKSTAKPRGIKAAKAAAVAHLEGTSTDA